MSASFKKLRAELCKRAEGACEHCGAWIGLDGADAHADHFWGRAKAEEKLETCWLLCIACDDRKTRYAPSSAYWLGAYVIHCEEHDYPAEKLKAEARLQFVTTRAAV